MKTKSPSVMGAIVFILLVIGMVAFGLINQPQTTLAPQEGETFN